jgi:HSP20 family protein
MTSIKFTTKPSNRSFNNLMDDVFATMPSLLRDDFITANYKSLTPVNIKERESDYVLEVIAPGFQKEDFRISLENNTLTVWLERKVEDEKNEKIIRREYRYQTFKRSFTIDEKIDAEGIVAKYLN